MSTKIKVSRLFPRTLHLFDAGLSVTHAEFSQPDLGIIEWSPFLQVQNTFLPHILLPYFFLCKGLMRLTSLSSLLPLCMARVSSANS